MMTCRHKYIPKRLYEPPVYSNVTRLRWMECAHCGRRIQSLWSEDCGKSELMVLWN